MNIEKIEEIAKKHFLHTQTNYGIGIFKDQQVWEIYSEKKRTDRKHVGPIDNTTLFDVASITKSILALVVLKLINTNKLDLDFKVNKLICSTEPSWDDIDIRSLLTNSLKLDIDAKLHFLSSKSIDNIIINAKVLRINDGYHYHNTTSIILGWFLEKFYQKPLHEIIHAEVFIPAEMGHTFFSSELHQHKKKVLPSEICAFRGLIHTKPHDKLTYTYHEHGRTVGSAGIFSCVPDMIKFGQYVTQKAFSDPEKMLALMRHNHLFEYGGTFGLGFDIHRPGYLCPCFEKNTLVSTGFTGCNLWINTLTHDVVTILTNNTFPERKELINGKSFLFEFRRLVAKEIFFCEKCMS